MKLLLSEPLPRFWHIKTFCFLTSAYFVVKVSSYLVVSIYLKLSLLSNKTLTKKIASLKPFLIHKFQHSFGGEESSDSLF